MNGIVRISAVQFLFIYLLLIVVLAIMKKSNIDKKKLLIVATVRMTAQLVLTGFVLQYILTNRLPIFTVFFLLAMIIFSIYHVVASSMALNQRFRLIVGASLAISSLIVLLFFVTLVVGKSFFYPQYTIPLAGMIIGNSMTGVNLALKIFTQNIEAGRKKIDTLINLGVHPMQVLKPFVNNALEAALLPTINSMLGMGIVFLPGMMTGQILSGTSPITAIMYQIAIMIAICTSVCLCVFCSLNFGCKTLFNKHNQFVSHIGDN